MGRNPFPLRTSEAQESGIPHGLVLRWLNRGHLIRESVLHLVSEISDECLACGAFSPRSADEVVYDRLNELGELIDNSNTLKVAQRGVASKPQCAGDL